MLISPLKEGGYPPPPFQTYLHNLSTDVYFIFLSSFLNVSNIGGSLIKKDLQSNNAVIVYFQLFKACFRAFHF